LRFMVNGAANERMRIDSSGNVGIGTNSPSAGSLTGTIVNVSAGSNSGYRAYGGGTAVGHLYQTSDLVILGAGENSSAKLAFNTGAGLGTERMRIDNSGRLVIGASSARVVGTTRQFTIEGTDSPTSSASIFRNSNTTGGAVLALGKSRGTSNGSSTVLQNGDQSGAIFFYGADGTDAVSQVASISAEIDGTPGSNDMPGRLVFNTTADGSYIVTERMRIDSLGRLLVGATSAATSGSLAQYAKLVLRGDTGGSTSAGIINLARGAGAASMSSGNSAGNIVFSDSAGLEFGAIEFIADGTPSGSSTPGRFVVKTTASSSTTPTERMRVASNGVVTVKNGAVAEIDALTDAATITPDLAASCNFSVTLGGNRTLANPSNITAGQSGSIFVTQDGTGSRTLAFGSYWDFAGGTAPTLTTTASAVDRIDYIVRSSTSIHAVATLAYS